MKKTILIIISIVISLVFSLEEKNKFIFNKKMNGSNSIQLNIDIENVTEVDGYKKITNNTNKDDNNIKSSKESTGYDYRNTTTWSLYNNPVNKKPGDKGYSWHHHTKEGRHVLKGLDHFFDID